MKRRNAVPAIPPFVDAWGRPTYENPCGQNRPNPALNGSGHSTAPIIEPLRATKPEHAAKPVVAMPANEASPVRVPRRERRAHQPLAISRGVRQVQRLAHQPRDRMPRRKALATVLGLLAVVVGASVAYAYFTSHGSGAGHASTGTLQPVTVAATVGGDTPSSILLPGGSAADVILRVSNPNARAVRLVSVSGNGAVTASGGTGTCAPTGVTFTNQPSLNVTIAASGTTLVHLAGAASMDTTSQTGCQGATFNIPVSITVHQP